MKLKLESEIPELPTTPCFALFLDLKNPESQNPWMVGIEETLCSASSHPMQTSLRPASPVRTHYSPHQNIGHPLLEISGIDLSVISK